MRFVTVSFLGLILAGYSTTWSASDSTEMQKCIERSLPFLKKGAVEWVQTNKCVTCHHVPMMLWTHYEARNHGFAINDEAVHELETQAIAQYLGHPEMTPTGQDRGFMEKTIGPGTIYLALAFAANQSANDEATKALERFQQNFIARQNEDGSWTTKVNQPPLVDDHDSMTMWILSALSDRSPNGKYGEARERALSWLKTVPVRNDTQPLALRILIAAQSDHKDDLSHCVQLLRDLQQQDGGWSQLNGIGTDALATGQALYALSEAGVTGDDPAVRRAWAFLASTQNADGSWIVHTRNPNGHDPIISFYGTGWATLGLLRTVPPPAEKASP